MPDPAASDAGPSRQNQSAASSSSKSKYDSAAGRRIATDRKEQKRAKGQQDATTDAESDMKKLRSDDDGEDVSGPSTPVPNARSEAGPSRSSFISNAPSGSGTYTPTSFTPLPRSLLSGATFRFSPSPEPALPDKASAEEQPSTPSRAASPTPRLAGDIYIEEVPRHPEKLPGEDASHFQPPGLFGTSLMPTLKDEGAGAAVELQKAGAVDGKGKEKEKEDSTTDGGLLLPTHVLVESHLGAAGETSREDDDMDDGDGGDDPMEGVHFVDDDISRGSRRYFDPGDDEPQEVEATFLATADQSKICQNCKRPGHRSRDCKHIICTTCGAEDQHERKDCPIGLVCFGCGNRGHRKQDCPDPHSRMSRRTGCDRCGSRDHMENTCHTIWRVYSYRSAEKRQILQQEKSLAVGWEKEAVGGAPSDLWCYNCAREGHLGDDCRERRGSLARLMVPSAFSTEMASRGPYASSSSSSRRDRGRPLVSTPATHSRWNSDSDTDLPHITGYKAFGGSNAGRRGREKAQARARAAHAGGALESDDEPSWFDNPREARGGMPMRGRGRGQATSTSTPIGRGAGGGRRPWDSEYRERSEHGNGNRGRSRSPPPPRGPRASRSTDQPSPFGHSHLMSKESNRPSTPSSAPAKVISFGKLSAPGSGNGRKEGMDSPSVHAQAQAQMQNVLGAGAAGGKRGEKSGAMALVNRALGLNGGGGAGGGGVGTPPNKKSRGKDKDKDKGKGKGKNEESLLNSPSPTPTPSISGSGSGGGGGGGDSPSLSKRKRKNKRSSGGGEDKDKERDWEAEWRRQGNGGGNVAGWGEEMDNHARSASNAIARPAGNAGGSGGFSIKGRAANNAGNHSGVGSGNANGASGTGQRYHGGY